MALNYDKNAEKRGSLSLGSIYWSIERLHLNQGKYTFLKIDHNLYDSIVYPLLIYLNNLTSYLIV